MITDPRFAPARSDLPFLRRRSRPKQPAPKAAPTPTPAVSVSPQPVPPRSVPPEPVAPGGSKIDYSRHATASRPASPPVATPPPATQPAGRAAPSSAPNDAARSPVPSSASSSLDLSQPTAAASTPRRRVPAAPEQSQTWRQRHVVRTGGRGQRILSVQDPTVTLTRVQSGIGEMMIEAMCSPEIGDLRLGAVYQLRSGGTGVVAQADGSRFGPSSKRPVLVGSREDYERVGVDLRQIADIERIAVFAYSESRVDLTWGGTLVITLDGGARLELPLERLYKGRLAMLATLYNMDGELVVRAELETISGDLREAARTYGFDRITWRDDRNPVD